ncbi:hypothetical protein KP509_08G017000 [Ceratopteris richardii]|uniref:Uncharacterized protein n=1 Tax=Ceratopteris richardii TaxID=49495 RepID=A0A8T2UEF2_CERRI|nr:hypothetical protein KP509_08G017000 [Ceratopteris richardii]
MKILENNLRESEVERGWFQFSWLCIVFSPFLGAAKSHVLLSSIIESFAPICIPRHFFCFSFFFGGGGGGGGGRKEDDGGKRKKKRKKGKKKRRRKGSGTEREGRGRGRDEKGERVLRGGERKMQV